MLGSLLKFELKYHFSQISFLIAAVLFLSLGCFAAIQGGFGGSGVHRNAPYVIANIVALFSLLTIFAATLFCGNVVLRDGIYKMESVVYTTAIRKPTYFMVRFVGLLSTVFALLISTVLGIALGTLLVDGSELGTFDLGAYLQPLLMFGLFNVLFATSLIFCTAVVSKNVRAIYVAGVLLYILYMVASILGNSPLLATSEKVNDPSMLPFLIDPFGLASFFEQTRNWTDLQRNQQLFPVNGTFLLNRLLWLTISILVIAIAYRLFNFRLAGPEERKPKKQDRQKTKLLPFKHFNVTTNGFNYRFSTFTSQFKLEVVLLFKHIPFMVMMVLWIFLFAVELKDTIMYGPYGIKYYPTTGAIIEELRAMKFALVLLVFYAAELTTRERSVNIQSLVYSTPVKGGVFWAAKCATLGLLVVVLVTANIAIGIALQLFNGYYAIEFSNYLSLYYFSGCPLFLFIVLIVFIQNLVSSKYLGMMLSMVVVFVCSFLPKLGIAHYMLRFAAVPDLQFSYFNGFGNYANAFNWYLLYWLGLTLIIAILTIGMWQSSLQFTFLDRLKSLLSSIFKAKYTVFAAIVAWLSTGAFIYEQTNIVGKYKSKQETLNWHITYEKKFKDLSSLPQPTIKSIKTRVDLFTDQGKYEVKGSYQLKNESDEPISKVWVTFDQSVTRFKINIPNADPHPVDEVFSQQFFTLKTPLLPGGRLQMDFAFKVVRSGFVPFDSENSIVANGSYIEMEKFVPHFGYRAHLEIDDDQIRKKEGLKPYQVTEHPDLKYHLVNLETTIATAANQQVVTVGTLKKSWLANNRHYFTYKTEAPINFMFALSSAVYQLKQESYKGITLRMYYQKGHENNVNTIFKAIKDALSYGSAQFSAYPLRQFTLAEIPQYKGAATAYPGLVFNAERINYLTDYRKSDKVNQSYAITAHEVAHQWWANILSPADVKGYAMLTESLAKYTEAVLLEKYYGKLQLSSYLKDDNNFYYVYRNPSKRELPLAQTYGQNNVHYQKGGLVMYALKELLGEREVNKTLHQLIVKHSSPNPKAVTQDLIGALMDVAPARQRSFINESFNQVVDYQMELQILSCKRLADGKYKVELTITVGKQLAGEPKLRTPDMDIPIAIFKENQSGLHTSSKPIYLQTHRFNQLVTRLSIRVDQQPKTISIDPYGYLLDSNLKDNTQEVK